MGWLIDPYATAITIFLPDQMPVVHLATFSTEAQLKVLPTIKGLEQLQLTATAIFDLLKI